jgi:RNA polymerase sigma-70 factor (ECF subfamily)
MDDVSEKISTGMTDPSEAEAGLVEQFRRGDAAAFEALFRKYQTYVFNVCHGILGNAEDAADVTQETFLRAHRSMTGFRGDAGLSTWLYRVAVNLSITELRRRTRHRSHSMEELCQEGAPAPVDDSRESEPGAALVIREESALVRKVLQTLPAEYRAVLVLRHFQELAYEEIAEVLQVSLSQVKTRLHRARRMFRDRFLLYTRDADELPAG